MFCQHCGTILAPADRRCQRCGAPRGAAPQPVRQNQYPLYGLGIAVVVLLAIDAAANVACVFFQPLFLLASFTYYGTVVVFLIWFYMARINAEQHGAYMRRARGWAIGAWFVPVIALWFPLQIMTDIWRANQPAEMRWQTPTLVGWWWACWLLAWPASLHKITEVLHNQNGATQVLHTYTINYDATGLSKAMAATAAVLLAVIVYRLSTGLLAKPAEPARPVGYPPADAPESPAQPV
jgi:hypothetical protein